MLFFFLVSSPQAFPYLLEHSQLGMAILHRPGPPRPEPPRPVQVAGRGRGKTFALITGAGQ